MMSHNKILSAAIVTALSMGGGTAQAADPTFKNTSPVADTTPTVAMELFETNNTQTLPDTGTDAQKFGVEYQLALDANITKHFYLIYTLSAGQWEGTLGVSNLSVANPAWAGSTTYLGGETQDTGDTTAKYVVRAGDTDLDKTATLTFQNFQLKDLTGLSTSGTAVSISVKLEYADDSGAVSAGKDVILVESGVGTKVDFSSGDDGNVKIDVATGGTFFIDGKYQKKADPSTNNTAASLGTIAISYPGNKMKDYTLLAADTNDWDFTNADNGVKDGTLTINNGPFAASSAALVFIDIDDEPASEACATNGTAGTDYIPANTVNTTIATWSLTAAQLTTIFSGTTKIPRKLCVAVPANNTTPINVPETGPTANLTINYHKHSGLKFGPADLRYIKRNGIVCTLYNVPDGYTTSDRPSIRITNRSSEPEGSELIGTLRATIAGVPTEVFKNVKLFNEKIKPNQTFTLNRQDLAKLAGLDEGNWGRGILTISSDLLNMEVFGLVRRKGGTTLMNMSKAASGEACGGK